MAGARESDDGFLPVALAVISALTVGRLAVDPRAWPLGAFFATAAYLLSLAFGIALAEWLRGGGSDEP